MELVYLWVEEYKNIYKQGFNFSPRFECEYKDGNLTICDKTKKEGKDNNHIDNFFGDNINITAIVGENGSGKSGILKFLKLFHYSENNGFVIFEKGGEKFYLGNENKYESLKKYTNLNKGISQEYLEFPFFDYSFTYDEKLNYSEDDYNYPKKKIGSLKGTISLHSELNRNKKNIILNYIEIKENNQLEKFKKFFQPKIINIYFDLSNNHLKNNFSKLNKENQQKVGDLWKEIEDGISIAQFIEKLKHIIEFLNTRKSYIKSENIFKKFYDKLKNIIKLQNHNIEFEDFDYEPTFPYKLGKDDYLQDLTNNLWSNKFNKQDIVDTYINKQKLKKIKSSDLLNDCIKFNILSLEIDKLNKEIIEILVTSFNSNDFTIEIIDKNDKKLDDLSFGEQQLLFILNQILSFKEPIIKEAYKIIPAKGAEFLEDEKVVTNKEPIEYSEDVEINNFIVLLDEIDIGFHPDWQKRVISYIVDFLKLIPEKNFHLIFTSHSPFLISDLPKENIIFLDTFNDGIDKNKELTSTKYPKLKDLKQRNCINVSEYVEIKPFGANIHTLLSDGFFMSGGLMGEFAKEKINDIVEFYNGVKNGTNKKEHYTKELKDKFHFIYKQIGEEYLKGIIGNHIDFIEEKLNDTSFKERKIKELKDELKKLRNG